MNFLRAALRGVSEPFPRKVSGTRMSVEVMRSCTKKTPKTAVGKVDPSKWAVCLLWNLDLVSFICFLNTWTLSWTSALFLFKLSMFPTSSRFSGQYNFIVVVWEKTHTFCYLKETRRWGHKEEKVPSVCLPFSFSCRLYGCMLLFSFLLLLSTFFLLVFCKLFLLLVLLLLPLRSLQCAFCLKNKIPSSSQTHAVLCVSARLTLGAYW